MKGALALRKPVATISIDMSGLTISHTVWTQLIASLTSGFSAVEMVNQSAQPMQIALGAVAAEQAIPYTVPPGGSVAVMAMEAGKGQRMSAKAIGADVSAGYLIINMFG